MPNDAERGQLQAISALGHELRRPLTVIRGAATLLLESAGGLDTAVSEQMLTLIDSNVEEMSDVIEDVLLMVHLEARDLGLFMEPVPAAEIVDAAVEHQRSRTAGYPLTVLGPAPGLRVEADRGRATRALRALIDNAARYSPPGTEIEISAGTQEPGRVRFEVCDRGPGIPGNEHERVFDRYAQLGSGAGSGLGLGLYLVRGVARAMGGEAGLAERRDGGLTVWFTLNRVG